MLFQIQPLVGVGDIRFGMSQKDVRQILKTPYETFMKSTKSIMPTDSFFDDAVHVFYDDIGTCEAVELYAPSQVILDDKNLMIFPYSEVRKYLLIQDPQLEEDDYGFTSRAIGIGAYAPRHRKTSDLIAEAIIVFNKGYYERHGL